MEGWEPELNSRSGFASGSQPESPRDIFQNWEALSRSFPAFVESIICKFLNASTVDGYNPYRITSEGIDWETTNPSDPWSYIGYWGDHQIIYLLKLLELSSDHHPGVLEQYLSKRVHAYANVPYRIRRYEQLLEDPHNTIDFDHELNDQIEERVERVGADGKLVWTAAGSVHLVNLTEKLLVTLLAKVSNFIPGAGIWMNTQRPEWNDANNALVGNGVSMVTLYYMRRFVSFVRALFDRASDESFEVAAEVAELFDDIRTSLEAFTSELEGEFDDRKRRSLLDLLGRAGERYRSNLYRDGFSGEMRLLPRHSLTSLLGLLQNYLDHTIRSGRRSDGLYHAYNLASFDPDGIRIEHLYEMLEGQVAVLSSGVLTAEQSVELLDALRDSALHREDQNSYLLYPDRALPRFTEKNVIPDGILDGSSLVRRLEAERDRSIVVRDVSGTLHFGTGMRNAVAVSAALDSLRQNGFEKEVDADRELILTTYETVFDHSSFTGRSGTFFGYEGLGCIYWHMVSKLRLAIAETIVRTGLTEADQASMRSLVHHYYRVVAGIGWDKSPDEYGAFPTDPYSHTPGDAGVQQPGMTGQVKEDILSRWAELGVSVADGQLRFNPTFLRGEEFLADPVQWTTNKRGGGVRTQTVEGGGLAFTYCEVPVQYRSADADEIQVHYANGRTRRFAGSALDHESSRQILRRTGDIDSIQVGVSQPNRYGSDSVQSDVNLG
ncbi:MAG: hypothetical protein R3282_00080 [Rhodothermales bacterium]|nr:hypothetical protein [Rhodothermales bacterium]